MVSPFLAYSSFQQAHIMLDMHCNLQLRAYRENVHSCSINAYLVWIEFSSLSGNVHPMWVVVF